MLLSDVARLGHTGASALANMKLVRSIYEFAVYVMYTALRYGFRTDLDAVKL